MIFLQIIKSLADSLLDNFNNRLRILIAKSVHNLVQHLVFNTEYLFLDKHSM